MISTVFMSLSDAQGRALEAQQRMELQQQETERYIESDLGEDWDSEY